MNRDEIKGKAKDIEGKVERKAGEWTGDEEAQIEGAGKQVEGKAQNLVGKVKKEGRDLADDIRDKAEEERAKADQERKDRGAA